MLYIHFHQYYRALRLENWLYHYGGSEHPDSKQIKNDLLRAFYPDDKEGKLDVWRQGKNIVEKVIESTIAILAFELIINKEHF